jgi:hypothetical protein
MANWTPYIYRQQTFDLSHLDAFEHEFVQPDEQGKSERTYRVWVRFSHHCFTEGTKPSDDPSLRYGDGRTFDVRRWELSKHLPDVIRSLMQRTVSHTGHNNYLTIEILDAHGTRVEYEVYFDVLRASTDKRIHLVVTSAFPRDMARLANRPKFNKIRFATILFNVQNNKPIRTTKR